jgi:hypothetical protein
MLRRVLLQRLELRRGLINREITGTDLLQSCGAQVAGGLRGMPTWNLDATASKDIGLWKLGDPAVDISNPTGFGVLGGQANTPRQMGFGLRIHF